MALAGFAPLKSDKVRFSRKCHDVTPTPSAQHHPYMRQVVSIPLLGRPKSPRLVVRFSVLIRREGGSLSMTIPRHVVRRWNLERGQRLVVRSTDEGILLYPRYFMPYSRELRRKKRLAQAKADNQPALTSPISSITCASVRPEDLRTWKLWSAPSTQCI